MARRCYLAAGSVGGMPESDVQAVRELLRDSFTRLIEHVDDLTDGLTDECRVLPPDGEANSIAWLIWHSARVQDLQLCDIAGIEQVWTRDGWDDRFGLDLPGNDHGYGHGPDDVGKVRAPADLLAGYYHAVHKVTLEYIASVTRRGVEPRRRHALDTAGHRERAAGQHHRRLRAAPRPGRLRARHRR